MPELRVRDIMTNDVRKIGRNDTLATADEIMRLGRIRHVVVIDEDGSLAGVLSQRDLFLGGLLRALGYGSHAKTRALQTWEGEGGGLPDGGPQVRLVDAPAAPAAPAAPVAGTTDARKTE